MIKEWVADLSDELRRVLERAIAARLPAELIEDASAALSDLVQAPDVISSAARARRVRDASRVRRDDHGPSPRPMLRRRTG